MAVRECEILRRVVHLVQYGESFPHGIALAVPTEFVGVHELSRCNAPHDGPRQKAVGGRAAQVAGRFPASAAGVVKRLFGIVGQRIARLRLRPTEVEYHRRTDSLVERRGHSGRIAAAGHRTQHRDPLGIDAVAGHQHVDTARYVPRHLPDETLPRQIELHPNVVPVIVVLPAHAELAAVVIGGKKRVLAPLAVSDLIHHHHACAGAGPRHAHVLQLAVSLRCVMAMDDDESRHRVGWFRGAVKIGGNPQAGPPAHDEILDDEAVPLDRARHVHFDRLVARWKLTERTAERGDPLAAKSFPRIAVRARRLVPRARAGPIGLAQAARKVALEHVAPRLSLGRLPHTGINRAKLLGERCNFVLCVLGDYRHRDTDNAQRDQDK